MIEVIAPFDDTRKALVFALNATDVQMPRPAMNVAMVEGLKARVKPQRLKRKKIAARMVVLEDDASEQDDALRAAVRKLFRKRPDSLTSDDRAAQAGMILVEFRRLDDVHQTILTGLLTRSHSPCNCRRPCCSGWAVNLRWMQAVAETCSLLKSTADVMKVGKRGMSTAPGFRKSLVEQYFTKRESSLTSLAAAAEISMVTAAKHRNWINAWLEETEDQAWQEADAILAAAGITGFQPE